jgi:MoxR-like ATPase
VGKHGTAKSFLLERLAQAMKLEYRFYNASLLNYDDLVGIPVPTSDQTALRYISTPTAVWEAEVVFLDEINRTRPDLQNKLFPLIHERRVQGVDLTRLRYRWAAMNPPALDADSESSENYLGAEPLDPALADRFAFILEVPDWDSLTGSEQRSILLDQFKGRHRVPGLDRRAALECQDRVRAPAGGPAVHHDRVPDRVRVAAWRNGASSVPRRLSTLMRNILAVHASRIALQQAAQPRNAKEPVEVDTETSVWTAVQHSQPSIAQTGRLDRHGLRAAHRHAWQLVGLDENDPWKSLLTIKDPVKRFIKAVETPAHSRTTPSDSWRSTRSPAFRTKRSARRSHSPPTCV